MIWIFLEVGSNIPRLRQIINTSLQHQKQGHGHIKMKSFVSIWWSSYCKDSFHRLYTELQFSSFKYIYMFLNGKTVLRTRVILMCNTTNHIYSHLKTLLSHQVTYSDTINIRGWQVNPVYSIFVCEQCMHAHAFCGVVSIHLVGIGNQCHTPTVYCFYIGLCYMDT